MNEEAKEILINSNLRLVVSIAKKYENRGVPVMDLVQEGNIGLMVAVNKFNPELGYRFSTYASYWIKHYIARAVANQARTIRIPVNIYEELTKMKRKATEIKMLLDRAPTEEELAESMGTSVERVRELKIYLLDPISLDVTVSPDDETPIESIIKDTRVEDPNAKLIREESKKSITKIFNTLEEREGEVIKMRFGFPPYGEQLTLEDVGKRLNISKEMVRIIEKKALVKLKHPTRAAILKTALGDIN